LFIFNKSTTDISFKLNYQRQYSNYYFDYYILTYFFLKKFFFHEQLIKILMIVKFKKKITYTLSNNRIHCNVTNIDYSVHSHVIFFYLNHVLFCKSVELVCFHAGQNLIRLFQIIVLVVIYLYIYIYIYVYLVCVQVIFIIIDKHQLFHIKINEYIIIIRLY